MHMALSSTLITSTYASSTSHPHYITYHLQREWGERSMLTAAQPRDLDSYTSGVQQGFEVNWEGRTGRSISVINSAYLWDPQNTYSFLKPGERYSAATGGPTGFEAG
jgi:hypothetical protein